MFSSLSRDDLGGSRAARIAIKVMILASICGGWAVGAHAQDVKKAIVKIVTSGIEKGKAEPVEGYVGSGFIVFSKEVSGEEQTVIVTADHVLGYSQSKAERPNNIFKAGELGGMPRRFG